MATKETNITDASVRPKGDRVSPTVESAAPAAPAWDMAAMAPHAAGAMAEDQVEPEYLDPRMLQAMQPLVGNQAVQRMVEGSGTTTAPEAGSDPVHSALGSGGWSGLDSQTRSVLEPKVGDLSHVQLKVDSASNESIGARAYTSGNSIVTKEAYNPGDPGQMQMMAEEVFHTRQQAAGPVSGSDTGRGFAMSDPSDFHERQAYDFSADVMRDQGYA